MAALRAMRSTNVFRILSGSSLRQTPQQLPGFLRRPLSGCSTPFFPRDSRRIVGAVDRNVSVASSSWGYTAVRAFAAEAGFPDRVDVTNRVLEVVRKFEKVQPEKVTDDSNFTKDLGLDSLDTVELVMALEDEFGVEIPDSDAEKIYSCTDAVEYLSNNIHAK